MELDVNILNATGKKIIRKSIKEARICQSQTVETSHVAIALLTNAVYLKNRGHEVAEQTSREVLADLADIEYPKYPIFKHDYQPTTYSPAVIDLIKDAQKFSPDNKVGEDELFDALTHPKTVGIGSVLFRRLGLVEE